MDQTQQPLSLMTININPNKRDDLLLIKILEASERKKQLIKRLLSPEEYDSLVLNDGLFQNENAFGLWDKTSGSIGRATGLEKEEQDDIELRELDSFKEEANEERAELRLPDTRRDLHESLARRREAIEFFHKENVDLNRNLAKDEPSLSIELRSGYYLREQIEPKDTTTIITSRQMLREETFSLFDRLVGFLNLFGLSSLLNANSETNLENGHQLVERCRGLNCEPYTSKRNLLLMENRLKSEGHLTKVLAQMSYNSEANEKRVEFGPTNLIDLARRQREKSNFSGKKGNKLSSKVELVQSVGHFNSIHLFRARKFDPDKNGLTEALLKSWDLFRLPLSVDWWPNKRRQNLLKLKSYPHNSRSFRIQLQKLCLKNHPLLSNEEKLSFEALDLGRKLCESRGQVDKLVSRFVEEVESSFKQKDTTGATISKLNNLIKLIVECCNQLSSMGQQTLALGRELQNTRIEQEFSSTSVAISVIGKGSILRQADELIRSLDFIIGSFSQVETTTKIYLEIRDRLVEFIRDEPQIVVLPLGTETTTTSSKLPAEEMTRRRQLRNWMSSLRLKLLFGDDYYYECQLKQQKDSFSLNLSDNQLLVPSLITSNKSSISLDITAQLYRLRSFYPVPFRMQILTSGRYKLLMKSNQTGVFEQVISLQISEDPNSLIELRLELSVEASIRLTQNQQSVPKRRTRCSEEIESLVDRLHSRVFVESSCSKLDDCETKLARLMNGCDVDLLLNIIIGHSPKRLRRYLIFEPFSDRLVAPKKSLRLSLIKWRWISNNMKQVIYLSERENSNNLSLRTIEFKSKMELNSEGNTIEKLDDSFKSIERLRILAAEYIKNYEFQLRQILKFNAEKLRLAEENRRRPEMGPRDLLREPELKFDLPSISNLSWLYLWTRHLVPRPSAHRPLMPKRRPREPSRNNLISSRADFMEPEMILSNLSDLEANNDNSAQDNSLNDSVQWQKSLAKFGASRLQLVISVQQAFNVPMRIVHSSGLSRPNSPPNLMATTSAVGHQRLQLASPSIPQVGSQLVTPTCYVEVVFQRKQQASSLAQGKNPTWNETLFFPVQVPAPGGQINAGQTVQLADEFLQLNLYDYHCYSQDLNSRDQQTEWTTMQMASNLEPSAFGGSGELHRNLPSALVQTSRQRTERHLLGSLRVPLTTLMSSGRIEGSFALRQPLILDNYQFEPEPEVGPSNLLLAQRNSTPSSRNSAQETRVSLFITLDPPISMPVHLFYLPTGYLEQQPVVELARLWELVAMRHRLSRRSTTSRQFDGPQQTGNLRRSNEGGGNQRHIRALILSRDLKYCLVCRLLTPLKPPDIELPPAEGQEEATAESEQVDSEQQMKLVARFVSLMSPLKYGLISMRPLASSLWFDSRQLVEQQLGGMEEKAVLLCNYFLFMGQPSGLLLGDAITDGRCVYVIVWRPQQSATSSDRQLQLQASDLIESISAIASGRATSGAPQAEAPINETRISVDRAQFLSRLPIQLRPSAVQLWDPATGKSYSLADQLPLLSVGSIVTMENVYANIQQEERPKDTNFDIRLKGLWLPLFESAASTNSRQVTGRSPLARSSRVRSLKSGAQVNWRRQRTRLEELRAMVGRPALSPLINTTTGIEYQALGKDECSKLEAAIEKSVKWHLLKWRPDRPTYFNRTLSRLLADRLARFEASCVRKQQLDWRSELVELIRNEVLVAQASNGRQLVSCPLNLPYTNTRAIVDQVFASGVHDADLMLDSLRDWPLPASSSSQFLVSCRVHPFPARVVSVWLYVAAIIPTQREASKFFTPI